jgi:hypothetical protein
MGVNTTRVAYIPENQNRRGDKPGNAATVGQAMIRVLTQRHRHKPFDNTSILLGKSVIMDTAINLSP